MILDFRLKDYKCNYYDGKYFNSGICFSLGCELGIIGKYTHITYVWPKEKQDQLNYCFLDKDALLRYFIEISKLLGFRLIAFADTEDKYRLQIECIPNRRYFIYISTYVRYVYEYPFSLFLYAAWCNRANFPELNITQIIQFYRAIFYGGHMCHCPGMDNDAFYNINAKCQFSLIKDHFNYSRGFVQINSNHNTLYKIVKTFNTKQLPQIVSGINCISNKYYAENKKNICRW